MAFCLRAGHASSFPEHGKEYTVSINVRGFVGLLNNYDLFKNESTVGTTTVNCLVPSL